MGNKYTNAFKNQRNKQNELYVEWIMSQPEGVTATQVKEHFQKNDINSVRMSLKRIKNVYISHWNRATKGHPQAIFKAVKEGARVPESAKSIESFSALDNRLIEVGHSRQGLTVIRGPWPYKVEKSQ